MTTMKPAERTATHVARIALVIAVILLGSNTALSDEEAAAKPEIQTADDEKLVSGMSVVGNDESPKSLVIVPWKSSELGDALDIDRGLLDGRRAVDRKVFARELAYYEIRTHSTPSPEGGNER